MKELVHYTVYSHPSDYPEDYVVRCWRVTPTTRLVYDKEPFLITKLYLEVQAQMLALGLVKLDRDINDDLHILETWI